MPFLIIDTSTERGIVALANKKQLIVEKQLPFGYQSSKYLFECIHELLKQENVEISDLVAIGVSTGPGSFTGIRVGVAAAKGICFSRKIPLISFNSLKAFVSLSHQSFASVVDAKMGGAYVLFQSWEKQRLNSFDIPKRLEIEEMKKWNKPGLCLVSPDSTLLRKKLSEKEDWNWEDNYPKLSVIVEELEEKYVNNENELWDLQIQY